MNGYLNTAIVYFLRFEDIADMFRNDGPFDIEYARDLCLRRPDRLVREITPKLNAPGFRLVDNRHILFRTPFPHALFHTLMFTTLS
jgi:hypothetical protein